MTQMVARRKYNAAIPTRQQVEQPVLEDKLRRIDARLAEIEATLLHAPTTGSIRNELGTERIELEALRRVTSNTLRSLRGGSIDPIEQERQRKLATRTELAIVNRAEEFRELYTHDAERCERAGDFHQARLFRGMVIRARELAEKELR